MAQDVNKTIEELKSKMAILMSMYSVQKSQNEQLKKDNEELKQTINKQQNSISELEQKVNTLQLAKAVSDSSSTGDKSARKYIEGIVREIDSCIALLNK
ncbi:MAG: hypothetical protein J5588_09385 [Bacteroidales bacterium]|jgi:chromosome segregation ATPase|nr:hypothetical protein [Bacteroidales bacterium]